MENLTKMNNRAVWRNAPGILEGAFERSNSNVTVPEVSIGEKKTAYTRAKNSEEDGNIEECNTS
ncbi:MAG: hypothetical protein ABSA92_13150 [Candidatus Bathyarchaeia archaeon]|jgi:hypothetical protein